MYIYFDTLCVLPHIFTYGAKLWYPLCMCICLYTLLCRHASHTLYVARPMSVAAGHVRRQKGQGLLRVGHSIWGGYD